MNHLNSSYTRIKGYFTTFRRKVRSLHYKIRRLFRFFKERLVVPVLVTLATVAAAACVWGLANYWNSLPAFWDWIRLTGNGVESGSTTIRNIGLVVAGLIALPLAIWRSMVAQKQSDVAQQSLLNERYQQGAEMLGSDVLSVRLGGIYALRRLAEEHPEQYHIQAMRLLCAFVRNPTKDEIIQPGEDSQPRHDVQIALDAICACHEVNTAIDSVNQFWLDFRDADLRGAKLQSVDLSVKLSFSGKTFAEIINSHISGADFAQAQLNSARMFSAKLPRANFSESDLSRTDLAYADLSGSRLWRADLSGAGLQGADLSGASLRRANLSRAYLGKANLSGAELSDDEFPESKVRGLTQAQLDEAVADPDNPPKLEGVLDAETGEQLVWRGGSA